MAGHDDSEKLDELERLLLIVIKAILFTDGASRAYCEGDEDLVGAVQHLRTKGLRIDLSTRCAQYNQEKAKL